VAGGEPVVTVPSILEKILAKKREEIATLEVDGDFERYKRKRNLNASDRVRSLYAALHRPSSAPVRVIAEIKRASPSAGAIRPDADPVAIAREYVAAGASAISVLTDREFFDGDREFMWPCRDAVSIPIVRKDFLIDRRQIFESHFFGADAVLLIVAALSKLDLEVMLHAIREYPMEALVEVHSIAEAELALSAFAPPQILGVNHRDLHTFAIDMSLTEQIAKRVPSDVVLVAESGIRTRDDIRRLGDAGAHAVLVGEHLMRAPSPGDALRELLS
jgi:indole-3-glycerol phosphate synthase